MLRRAAAHFMSVPVGVDAAEPEEVDNAQELFRVGASAPASIALLTPDFEGQCRRVTKA